MPLKFGFPVIGDIVQILSGVIDDLIVRNLRTNDPGVGPAIEIRETNPEDIFWFDSANLQRVAMGIASDELSWRINSGLPVQVQTAAGDSFVVVADGVTMDPFTQPGDVSLITFQTVRLIGVAGVQALSEGPVTLESQTDDVTIDAGTLGSGNVEMSGDELRWNDTILQWAGHAEFTTNVQTDGGPQIGATVTVPGLTNGLLREIDVVATGHVKLQRIAGSSDDVFRGYARIGGNTPTLDARATVESPASFITLTIPVSWHRRFFTTSGFDVDIIFDGGNETWQHLSSLLTVTVMAVTD